MHATENNNLEESIQFTDIITIEQSLSSCLIFPSIGRIENVAYYIISITDYCSTDLQRSKTFACLQLSSCS